MPRHASEFKSGLPGVAELAPSSLVKKREVSPRAKMAVEQAQLMGDIYQDIKNAWEEFVRSHKQEGKERKERIDRM